jgi:glutamyl-tRNA reductase
MELVCVGLSWRTSPLEVREKLAAARLDEVRALPGVKEAALVQTCNRVEAYLAAEAGSAPGVREALARAAGVALDGHLYEKSGEEALRHLFRVAASLDSMVVGEPQILGQVKEALAQAEKSGAAGPVLGRAFQRAFAAARRARRETAIAEGAVSMASVAVEMAERIFADMKGRGVLLVGAGEMAERAAESLQRLGAARLYVANRSAEAADALAKRFAGEALPLEKLGEALARVDAVLCSTGAPHFVIGPDLLKPLVHERKYRPLLLVDLSVPRNVDPRCADLPQVYLFDTDDLERAAAANRGERAGEAAKAEAILEEELKASDRHTDAQHVIRDIHRRAEEVVRAEVEKTLHHLGAELDDKQRKSVEAMAHAIANKLLHEPTAKLREQPEMAPLVEELFAPHRAAEPEPRPKKPEGG